MSIKVMSHVWEYSQQKGSYLLTLLAIADYAHDDGTQAYPSVATLAKKTRMTDRNVQCVLRKLEESGELIIQAGAGPRGCHLYSIPLQTPIKTPLASGGENFSEVRKEPLKIMVERGEKKCLEGVKGITPNPSLEPLKEKKERTSEFCYAMEENQPITCDPPTAHACYETLAPADVPEEVRQTQCAENLSGLAMLRAAVWRTEAALDQRIHVQPHDAGCPHEHVDTNDICNDGGEVLAGVATALEKE